MFELLPNPPKIVRWVSFSDNYTGDQLTLHDIEDVLIEVHSTEKKPDAKKEASVRFEIELDWDPNSSYEYCNDYTICYHQTLALAKENRNPETTKIFHLMG